MAATDVLAELVSEALTTQQATSLNPDKQAKFHQDFQAEVLPDVEKIRTDKRRAYEETQDLAFW